MITIDNYFDATSNIIWDNYPEAIRKGHDYLKMATDEGAHWTNYYSSESVKRVIDLYLAKLNELVNKEAPSPQKKKENLPPEHKDVPGKAAKPREQKATTAQPSSEPPPDLVERIPEELRVIRRFVNLDGKSKTKEELLRFINSLQKAIVEKRIRKTSAYAGEIQFIQDRLIEVYNHMKAKITIELKPETRADLIRLTEKQRVMASINFVKRYLSLNGKSDVKEKARRLLDQINRALDRGKINDSDPYIVQIHELKKHLYAFANGKGRKVLEIEKATLNGLNGILGCASSPLNGPDEKPLLMNSMDFANMRFVTIGLKGKWRDLIGDPSPNFTAMVFGKPKMGKSYLCIDFAGYLARHHGKVLYVAKEEGLDMTLQKKLADKNVAHPSLFVSEELPANLDRYDFIFLDSVNRLGLIPTDLVRLKSDHPSKSFVFVFQSTKDGNFRGSNSFQHDVDIVVEIPEKGKAIQNGRFNQGGRMDIF
jgi:hypothetical protein